MSDILQVQGINEKGFGTIAKIGTRIGILIKSSLRMSKPLFKPFPTKKTLCN